MAVNFSAAAPPKRQGRKPTGTATVAIPEAPRSIRDVREEGLNGIAQLVQGGCLMLNQHADAATIGKHFPPLSHELANLADNYEVLAKPIDLIIQLGPFTALIAAAMPLVTQIMVNHRMAKPGVMGTVPPEMLSAQIQTEMMRTQAEMMRAQREAQAELAQAQAFLESEINAANGGMNDSPSVQ